MSPLVEKLLGWLRLLPAAPLGPVEPARPASESPARPTFVPPDWRASQFGNRDWHYGEWRRLATLLAGGRAPAGLTVPHALSLAKLRIRSLPVDLTIHGDLDLRQCQRLNRIGDGLCVWGDLSIGGIYSSRRLWWEEVWLAEAGRSNVPPLSLHILSRDGQCPLSTLPSNLRVGGDLRLHQARRLEQLPDDMIVGRSIELMGCSALARLPRSIEVHGDLTILGAPRLAALPDRLVVKGNLRVVGTRIEQLPPQLSVGGDLVLEDCPRLAAFPDGLSVGGSLTVHRCPFTRVPADLRVGSDLRFHQIRDIEETPVGLAAPGRITLIRCPSLRRIGRGLRVGSDLNLRRCERLQELPEGLVVPGTLDLRGSATLAALPRGLDVGSAPGRSPFLPALRLADCPALTSLPDDLTLGGPIEVAGSGLRDLPERLARSARILWRGVLVPPEVVFRPGSLTPQQILGQRNAELRRVMLERVGLEDVLRRAGAEVLDLDIDAGGERRLVMVRLAEQTGQSRFRWYLQCRCPSTGREYLLRVPPETRTCREAAAWLAGFDDPDAYRPIGET